MIPISAVHDTLDWLLDQREKPQRLSDTKVNLSAQPVVRLIQAGEDFTSPDASGVTPMMCAAGLRACPETSLLMAKVLVQHGAATFEPRVLNLNWKHPSPAGLAFFYSDHKLLELLNHSGGLTPAEVSEMLDYLGGVRFQDLGRPFRRSCSRADMLMVGKLEVLAGDVGDHVVVINTKEVAMQGEYWRRFKYFHHTGYPGGFSEASAWRVHEIDPTRVMHQAVYCRLPGNLLRKGLMRRLHLYPDDAVPDEIMENISDQIRQVQEIPKRLDEYTEEEIQEFPKLFDWPEDHVKDEYKKHLTKKKPKRRYTI
nr:hypothetical protein BaRGS_009066 [Batillaria attramentaria]